MKCVFCSKQQQPGQGIIFVYSDGRVIYFCSSKCRRNFRMKRDPKKIKWAKQIEKKERTDAFEKKREVKSEARAEAKKAKA
jgi:large subunit ribosomal protein L24e